MRTSLGAWSAAALAVFTAPVWAQASEQADKDGISPAFWIAVSVPIVLGVLMAIRAASAKKQKGE